MTPEELLNTIRAFQESRALLTAIEFDLFTYIAGGATAAQVAARITADPRATEMLLDALTAMEVLEKRGGVYRNSPLAAEQLTGDARMALMHQVHLWRRWSTLTECVRKGTSVTRDEPRTPDSTEAFIAAMHRNATTRAPEVVKVVDASKVRRMLDVGGGSGAYSIAFARANPELEAELLDLPTVVPIASRHIAAAGLEGRVRLRSGDLKRDDFGSGFDLVLLSAICHMLSVDENRNLLARCAGALRHGGRIVIQDFVLDPDKTSPRFAALFSLNMLVGTERGASYSEPEYRAWLQEAGMREVTRIDLQGGPALMIGTK
ncbi:MAG: methyltransferase [bacterium]|jgi:SAM-dependent methyltransferase